MIRVAEGVEIYKGQSSLLVSLVWEVAGIYPRELHRGLAGQLYKPPRDLLRCHSSRLKSLEASQAGRDLLEQDRSGQSL